MADDRWKIHKFGGTSLADATCFHRVAGILLNYKDTRIGVVVSAMSGMTDALINLVNLAAQDDDQFMWVLYALEAYIFIFVLYFVFCFSMSRYSAHVERDLSEGRNL